MYTLIDLLPENRPTYLDLAQRRRKHIKKPGSRVIGLNINPGYEGEKISQDQCEFHLED